MFYLQLLLLRYLRMLRLERFSPDMCDARDKSVTATNVTTI